MRRTPIHLPLLLVLLFAAGCDSGAVDSDGRIYAGGVLFGWSLALDGDVALVGANASNEAFLLQYEGGSWRTASRLTPSDSPVPDPRYAWDVALGDGVAVVGAPERDLIQGHTGAAYVYERVGGSWAETAVLRPGDLSGRPRFGTAVATSAGRVVVGAPSDGKNYSEPEESTDWGTVHVFEKRGGAWTRTARLTNPSPMAGVHRDSDGFGGVVVLDGDRLAVHAGSLAETGLPAAGLVRIYESAGDGWAETARISHPDAREGDNLGSKIALDGPLLAAVASGRREEGIAGASAAYVFRHNGSGWDFETKFMPEDLGYLDSFGLSLAANGDRVAVGAPGRNRTRGAVFVWARQPSGAWALEAELSAEGRGPGTRFGESIGLDGDRMLVGAFGIDNERGGAFEFRREGGVWRQVTR